MDELRELGIAPSCEASGWVYKTKKKIAYNLLKAWNSSIVSGQEELFTERFKLNQEVDPTEDDDADSDSPDPVKSAVAAGSAMAKPAVADAEVAASSASEKPAVADT